MHKINLTISHQDQRGSITDLIVEEINAVTLIKFVRGAVRGNHYHNLTTQWCFVTKGKLEVSTLIGESRMSEIFSAGDFFVSLPSEPHAFCALEDSEILTFTSGPRAGTNYEEDTYRIEII